MRPRLRVKFMAKGNRAADAWRWLRQFPGRVPRWGDCEFLFDPEAGAYDWLVAYDDLAPRGAERFSARMERLACPREHTLLVTAEPAAVKTYGSPFCEQFGWVLTSQEPWALSHPRAVRGQTGYRWFYGLGGARVLDFDALAAMPEPAKTGLVSTLCSSKAQRHTLHHARLAFTRELAARLPELEVYGRGVRPVADKAEALDSYRYHLAVENHLAPHHFTEKLSDAFLGWCLPVYHGAPDVEDYFPAESVLPVPGLDPGAVAELLRDALGRGRFEASRRAIAEARRRVLFEYNLFATLARFIGARHQPGLRSRGGELAARHVARRASAGQLLRHHLERWRVRRRLRRGPGG